MFESQLPPVGDPAAPGEAAEPGVAAGETPNWTLMMAVVTRPGPAAMTLLEQVDRSSLGQDDAMDLLVCWERSSRWVAAQHAAAVVAVAGFARDEPGDRMDADRELVRSALSGCGGSARTDVDVARDLAGPLTAAGRALARGEISWDHAKVISRETELLDGATRTEVADAVVAAMLARPERPTPGELRRRVRRAVILADPLGAELRAEAATARRCVQRWVDPDGQGRLAVAGPAAAVALIWTAMDLRAAHPAAADERTLDQRRFDALVDICVEATFGPDTEDDPADTVPALAADGHVVADEPADATAAALPTEPVDAAGAARGPVADKSPDAAPAALRAEPVEAAGATGEPVEEKPAGAAPAAAALTAAAAVAAGAAGGPGPSTVGGGGSAGAGTGVAFGIPGAAARLAERAAGTPAAGTAGKAARPRSGRRGIAGCVYLYADAATWAGLADDPVELAGYGPIPAGQAREFFASATWRAVVADTITGATTSVSDKGYVPSARTLRHLHVQDRGCLFPGCPGAIWYCDTDHNQPYDKGGCTDTHNCGLLCRRHHLLKTFHGWTWQRLPHNLGVEWTDPRGRHWYRPPNRYLLPPAHPGQVDPDPDGQPAADLQREADRRSTEDTARTVEAERWELAVRGPQPPPPPPPPPEPAPSPYPEEPPFR